MQPRERARIEVLHQIAEDDGARRPVKEHHLVERAAASDNELVDHRRPGRLGPIRQLAVEPQVRALGREPRRRKAQRVRIGPLPIGPEQVVQLVGRDQPARRAQGLDRAPHIRGECDR